MLSTAQRACGALVVLLAVSLVGCTEGSARPTTASRAPATIAVPLDQTSVKPFEVDDFDAVHGPPTDDGNAAPIFGALPIEEAGTDVPAETAAFLGRWEGFGLGPPIKRDWKYVLAVTEIEQDRGIAYVWAATNLQFPAAVARVAFRVHGTGPGTTIEWEQTIGGAYAIVRIAHARGTEALEGTVESSDTSGRSGPILLRRDSADHVVYRDYGAHLAEHGIAWRAHETADLLEAGSGSLVHLPAGYDDDPGRSWPLILFLHGSGDRGDNGLVIAQNSPLGFAAAGNALDAIVVAPLLAADHPAFPIGYLDAILDDAIARYRVDPARVTVTGLSMGGEAAYRLARHRPRSFAGVAVLCGWDPAAFPESQRWGYVASPDPVERLRGLPIRAIHGRDDITIPLPAAEATVDLMTAAGVEVDFRILEHRDHDVWTETYRDPAFFEWLLGLRHDPA